MMSSSIIKKEIANFAPAYFAMVMATGIIATASQQLHYNSIAKLLFILNNVLYFILAFLFVIRMLFFFKQVKADISNHAKGAGFLTFVAGSCILGNGYVQQKQLFLPGIWLLVIALIAWLILMYSFLSLVILKSEKPSPENGFNGSWLLLVVSTQALTILCTLLAPHLGMPVTVILFISSCTWLLGILLYVVVLTIIVYRLLFYPVKPAEVSPSYWIDTGAAAISTLAGIILIKAFAGERSFEQYVPGFHILIMLLWAVATFWLPLLAILEIWRHYKAGFAYSAAYWSMVFPLGMYTIATLQLGSAMSLPFLKALANGFIYIAWAAWLVVFIGMLMHLLKGIFAQNVNKVTNSK